MKKHVLIALLFLVFTATLTGQSEILDRKVRIDSREGSIGSILDEISRVGGFFFSYSQDIPWNKKVRLQHKHQTVQQYLDEIFQGEIYCVSYGDKLLIKLKPKLPEFYTVQGKVIDSGTENPVPGATVVIPGSDPLIGAVCDDSGRFQINVPRGMDAIQFSCIGYESLRLSPEHTVPSTITLFPINQEISEVVIEYPSLPVKIESSVAISKLSGKRLELVQGSSIENALQGSASGIHVVSNSGMPGASFQVKIRGSHSLINSDPVYYLNGIPLQLSLLNAVSIHDIASVEVYKDASSTAMYGASAGNGVVLLHSKIGSMDEMSINLDYQIGTQHVRKELDLMGTEDFLSFSEQLIPSESEFEGMDETYRKYDTDWMKLMFHPAKVEDVHLSIAGGNERSQYYIGTGYYNQASIIKELKFNRFSFNLSSDHQVNKRWKLGHNLTLAHMRHEGLKEGSFLNDHNNPVIQCFIKSPLLSPIDTLPEPNIHAMFPGRTNQSGSPDIEFVEEELTNNLRKNYAVFGNLFSKVEVSRNISFESVFGYEVLFQNNRSCNRSKTVSIPIANNPVLENDYQVLDLAYHWKNHLDYSKIFAENHQVRLSLGFEIGHSENEWIPVEQNIDTLTGSKNYASSYLDKNIQNLRKAVEFRNIAGIGTLSYIFKGKYMLGGTLKRENVGFDSTEVVYKQYSTWYPSVSLGWIFLQRPGNTHRRILSFGKIRYAYGEAGNSPKLNYSFHAKLMRDMAYAYSFSSAGNITNSSFQRQANERFYLEKVSAHNLGVELGLLGNKLFISTEFFMNQLHKGEKSQYVNPRDYLRRLNGADGYGIVDLPVAELANSGIEGMLSYKQAGRVINWDLSLHLTHLQNRIIDIDSTTFSGINKGSLDPISVNLPGKASGSFFGYKIERIFTENDIPAPGERVTHQPYTIDAKGNKKYAQPYARAGDYKFMDINHDSIIDKNDKTIIGNPYPDFIFGLYANMQFRQFDLSMFWQGTYGNEIYNATKLWLYNPYGTNNWSKKIRESYRSPTYNESDEMTEPGNTDTDLHRWDYYAENKNLRVSDFYIEDGSYLRLKNIQVGYTFDPAFSRKIHIEKLRIYFCAQNLLTFTKYSGLDPEIGGWGIDCGIYPQPRTFIAGINIGF